MSVQAGHRSDPGNDVITAPEAARENGVNRVSVYKAIRDGRLSAVRSGRAYLIRRRDLDQWEVVGHRPQRGMVGRASAGQPILTTGGADQGERMEKAIHLLEEWMADESGHDEETWPKLKEALDQDRLSTRRLFDE
jgi:excisionase family DNA binding protein